jgi:hypothetical protein
MGPDDGNSGERFVAESDGSFKLKGCRRDLSQVKDATEKAGLLLIVFMRAGRLELLGRGVGRRRHSWVFRPMMM